MSRVPIRVTPRQATWAGNAVSLLSKPASLSDKPHVPQLDRHAGIGVFAPQYGPRRGFFFGFFTKALI
jgi:hypothetical protein